MIFLKNIEKDGKPETSDDNRKLGPIDDISIYFLIEVYGQIFLGNSISKILLYIVHRNFSLTCAFRLIILCVSSEELSEAL